MGLFLAYGQTKDSWREAENQNLNLRVYYQEVEQVWK